MARGRHGPAGDDPSGGNGCRRAVRLRGTAIHHRIEPAGRTVYVEGQQKGATPLELPFQNYGNHDFTLVKEGYETRTYHARVRMPWFEWFPLDFFSENVYPRHIQDNRLLQFEMSPLQQPRTEDIMNQAKLLRDRGMAVPSAPPKVE